jgi:hypothetical protein
LYHFGLLLNHVIGHLYPFLSIYDDWGCYNYVFFGYEWVSASMDHYGSISNSH